MKSIPNMKLITRLILNKLKLANKKNKTKIMMNKMKRINSIIFLTIHLNQDRIKEKVIICFNEPVSINISHIIISQKKILIGNKILMALTNLLMNNKLKLQTTLQFQWIFKFHHHPHKNKNKNKIHYLLLSNQLIKILINLKRKQINLYSSINQIQKYRLFLLYLLLHYFTG